jgi:hypothetical protein
MWFKFWSETYTYDAVKSQLIKLGEANAPGLPDGWSESAIRDNFIASLSKENMPSALVPVCVPTVTDTEVSDLATDPAVPSTHAAVSEVR